jgi:hypothetical protein
MDEKPFPEPDGSSRPAQRLRRRGRTVLVLLLAVAGVWLYFKWPRPMPAYVVLPRGHGHVWVESWLVWGAPFALYRQFYVQTEVTRPWREVLQELKAGHDATVHEFIDLVKLNPSDLPSAGVADRQKDEALIRRWCEAGSTARPLVHGGFGDVLPDSFVVFRFRGPEAKSYLHHWLTYRLTVLDADRTFVEVWDNKSYDH